MRIGKIRNKKKEILHNVIPMWVLSILILSSFLTFNTYKSSSSTNLSDEEEVYNDVHLYLFDGTFGHKMSINRSYFAEENVKDIEWKYENALSDDIFINSVNLSLIINNSKETYIELIITLLKKNNGTTVPITRNVVNLSTMESMDFFTLKFIEGDNYTFEKGSWIVLNITSNETFDIRYEDANLNLRWKQNHGVLLKCDNIEKTLDIGEPYANQKYIINLTNIGEKEDTFILEIVEEDNKKWISEFYPSEVTLPPDESKDIRVLIYQINMTNNEIANITLKATSLNSPFPISDSIETVTIATESHGFFMVATSQENSINWGEKTNYNIIITNNKTTNISIDFSISSPPEGWNATISKKNINLKELGKTSFLVLTVSAPPKYSEKYNRQAEIKIFATIKNSSFSSEITTLTTIKENPNIKINEIIFSNDKPIEGQKINISAKISNIGREKAKIIILFIDGSKNESATIGIKVIELKSNQSKFVVIYWNTTEGEHTIFVVAKTLDYSSELDYSSKTINVLKDEMIEDFVIVAAGGAIGIAFIIAFITETGRYSIFKIFAIPLYTRIRKDEVLDHDVRQKVYTYIQSNPGAHFRSIMKSLCLKNGALAYHLTTLERAEYIKSQRDGMYRKFYLKPGRLAEPSKILKTPNEVRRLILEKIRMEPGISQSKIAQSIGESRQLVNNYVKVLREEGRIYLKKNGRESRCFIEEA